MSFFGQVALAVFAPYEYNLRRSKEKTRKFKEDKSRFSWERSDTELVAKYMHDRHEYHADKKGWATNKLCRVPFEALPQSKRNTMMAVAADLMKYLKPVVMNNGDDNGQ